MADGPPERVELLTGWSRTAPTAATVVDVTDEAAVDGVAGARRPTRSDRARASAAATATRRRTRAEPCSTPPRSAGFHDIDLERGVIRVDAGVSLEAIMRTMVPLGWFVHVTPGTRLVTVGGAIAADVHGKSHHVDGSFANHVESFTLHTPKGTVTVTPESDAELFWGTAGALGLTGVIAEATIRLLPIETSMIRAENLRCPDLDSVMALMVEGDDRLPLLGRVDRLPGDRCVARTLGALARRPRDARRPAAEAAARPAALRAARRCSRRRRGPPTACSTGSASPPSTSSGTA